MKTILKSLLLVILSASYALAADAGYTILGISEVKGDEQSLVDRAWRTDSSKRLLAKLRAS